MLWSLIQVNLPLMFYINEMPISSQNRLYDFFYRDVNSLSWSTAHPFCFPLSTIKKRAETHPSPLLHDVIIEQSHKSYELLFIARVTSYVLYTSNKLLFITWVTSYELRVMSYGLRITFHIWITNCCLLHKLRVTFYIRVTSYCLMPKLRVTFYIRARVTVYC